MNQLDRDNRKIALMSFHNGFNYGAALQAYALQKAVSEMGFDCEYIDYVNNHRRELYDMGCRFRNALKKKDMRSALVAMFGFPFMQVRKANFSGFYRKYVKKTNTEYKTSDEAKKLNNIYDKFVIGSDQVWNPVNNGTDWAFLLDFVENQKKKISYSSSFGLSDIPEEYRATYRDNLKSFYRLAVREMKGVELIRELTGRDAHLVMDPVFLLDTEAWKKMTCSDRKSKPYVFVYTDSMAELMDFQERIGDWKYEYHILCSDLRVRDFLKSNYHIRISMSPETFLTEILNADYIITDSFHCLAFSLIFQKDFLVFLSGNEGKDERLLNLIRMTHLEDRVYKPDNLAIGMQKRIDYQQVNLRLKPQIEYSKEYLLHALSDQQDIDFNYPEDVAKTRYMCEDNRCTGCFACASACPVGAIMPVSNMDGFTIPVRDSIKCIDCGLCHRVCQVFQNPDKRKGIQTYWAVKNSDDVRHHSTSGGVFTAISDAVLSQNGVIVAATLSRVTFRLSHCIAENKEQRDQMRRTYYVQSELGDSYRQIKDFLKDGRKVLFVGNPCQVYGLKLFVGREDKNLLTCDIVCHGVSSPALFKAFIQSLRERGELTDYLMRDKSIGWRGYTDTAVINGKKIKNKPWLQSFDKMFSHSLINRECCTNCRFTNYDRIGDITIGDCWGIERACPTFEDYLGVSLVMLNTEKGAELFNSLDGLQKTPLRAEQCKQNSLTKPPIASRYRNQAMSLYRRKGYKQLAKKYGEDNLKGVLFNMLRKARFLTQAVRKKS